jgi:hypothetical protein
MPPTLTLDTPPAVLAALMIANRISPDAVTVVAATEPQAGRFEQAIRCEYQRQSPPGTP